MRPVCADFEFDSRQNEQEHFWYLPHTPRPAGAHTQWLSFRFRLERMIEHSPASHFAIVLRARLGLESNARPVSISGRGITLGDTSLATPGDDLAQDKRLKFGGSRGAQIESFWPGGNFLFRDTALQPTGLRDACWYRVHVHVGDRCWIGFGVQPEPIGEAEPGDVRGVRDLVGDSVQDDDSGLLIALGRGPCEAGNWKAEFRQIASGWF
jgi:hypothetical protein